MIAKLAKTLSNIGKPTDFYRTPDGSQILLLPRVLDAGMQRQQRPGAVQRIGVPYSGDWGRDVPHPIRRYRIDLGLSRAKASCSHATRALLSSQE